MAGNYPDVPAARMAWDIDGSVAVKISSSNVITTLTQANATALNDESDSTTYNGGGISGTTRVAVIFPELRDIVGIFLRTDYGTVTYETSTDTTNGLDGTWTARTSLTKPSSTIPNYRSEIALQSISGVKAVRFSVGASASQSYYTLQIFGTIAAGQTPDRLRFWHPTLDQPLSSTPAFLDWGDVPRGGTATKQFRIKNNSAGQTSQGVSVSLSVPTEHAPTLASQFALSTDGVTFGATATIGDLAPGAISGLVTLRKATSATAQLGTGAARLVTAVTGWV